MSVVVLQGLCEGRLEGLVLVGHQATDEFLGHRVGQVGVAVVLDCAVRQALDQVGHGRLLQTWK